MQPSAAILFARLAARSRMRHLQLVAKIGELGHLQKAAVAVGLSQPAATHALAELEELLGRPLFERHAKGMRPTDVGEALLPLIRRSLASLHECAEVVAAMSAGTTSALRIGAIGAAISGLLGSVLSSLSARQPEMAIDVVQMRPDELVLAVGQGTIDVALCRRPAQLPSGARFVELASDRYAVVCDARHPLAGRADLDLAMLALQHWLAPPADGIAGRDFHQLWKDQAVPPPICWVSSRATTVMLQMLRSRPLLVFLPYRVALPWLETGLLVELPGPWAERLPALGALLPGELPARGVLRLLVDELAAIGGLAGPAANS